MKYKKTYKSYELSPPTGIGSPTLKVFNGKNVRYWKRVHMAFDFSNDEYIPIYYKGKGRYAKPEPKKNFFAKLFNL